MNNTADIIQLLRNQGVLPLFYHADPEVCRSVIDVLYKAGIRSVEFTNRGEAAVSNFRTLIRQRDHSWSDLLLAAGTIKTTDDARTYISLGADYIICPAMIPAVAETVQKAGKLWIPGCMTPSEIVQAEQLGAKLIKLFPGSLLGPSFVSAIREVFPALLFMPTGGVEPELNNLKQWFSSGVTAVGMGSKLISKELLERKAYDEIGSNTENLLRLIRSLK
jgi:2-dehydro-3-deoxyphosphogluconate aldolase/(4S)-4-hydroxy-2-oxoglutarate aldolase